MIEIITVNDTQDVRTTLQLGLERLNLKFGTKVLAHAPPRRMLSFSDIQD